MFVVALTAAIIVKVPETVRCPFVLAPKEGADPIQAPYQGVVSEVRVAGGTGGRRRRRAVRAPLG
jgi:hypothetical protein